MSWISRILVPVDLSQSSLAAVRYAAFLAEHDGAQLFILHADGQRDVAEQNSEALEEFLAAAASPAVLSAHVESVAGSGTQALSRLAGQHHVDLIVMGKHGDGTEASSTFGNVAHCLNERTPPVVSVYEATSAGTLFSLCPPSQALFEPVAAVRSSGQKKKRAEADQPSVSAGAKGVSAEEISRLPRH